MSHLASPPPTSTPGLDLTQLVASELSGLTPMPTLGTLPHETLGCEACRDNSSTCLVRSLSDRLSCTTCDAIGIDCSFKNRVSTYAYVERLEERMEKMEKLLLKLQRADRPPASIPTLREQTLPYAHLPSIASKHGATAPNHTSTEDVPYDWERHQNFAPKHPNLLGESSQANLIQTLLNVRRDLNADVLLLSSSSNEPRSVSQKADIFSMTGHLTLIRNPKNGFPEPDLLRQLIDSYFRCYNDYFPLLHRSIFERSVASGLHTRDPSFGAVLLLVCALGAFNVKDERVYFAPGQEHSAGWAYFREVRLEEVALMKAPKLHAIQVCVLATMFMWSTSKPVAAWSLVGIAMHLLEDAGAHRREAYSDQPNINDELWKRAFWMVYFVDRHLSCSLGRTVAITEEDMDVGFPIDRDDEFWELDGPLAFNQPADKPSSRTFFIVLIQLLRVTGYTMRTLYAPMRSRAALGQVGLEWRQDVLAKLHTALNEWRDNIPTHLKWDPHEPNIVFFNQAAVLSTYFYLTHIFVHRPFLGINSGPKFISPPVYSSLAFCIDAAISIADITEYQQNRSDCAFFAPLDAAISAAPILCLSVFSVHHRVLNLDPQRLLEYVLKYSRIMERMESRYCIAGKLGDVFHHAANINPSDLSSISPVVRRKRRRNTGDEGYASSPSNKEFNERPMAGSRRVSSALASNDQANKMTFVPPYASKSRTLDVLSSDPLGEIMPDYNTIQPSDYSSSTSPFEPNSDSIPPRHTPQPVQSAIVEGFVETNFVHVDEDFHPEPTEYGSDNAFDFLSALFSETSDISGNAPLPEFSLPDSWANSSAELALTNRQIPFCS